MALKAPPPEPKAVTKIQIDGEDFPLVEIRTAGDLLLDVHFDNGAECQRSIPKDVIREIQTKRLPKPSPRIVYRVRLETLQKHSEYFRILLTPKFSEGVAVAETHAKLVAAGENPTEVEAEKLPRVTIVDEATATKTLGRELVFRDLLRIIHGLDVITSPFTTHCLTTLVITADMYNMVPFLIRHFQKTLLNHKYPVAVDRGGEEILRQKVLIQYHTDQGLRLTSATRDLIMKGSIKWNGTCEDSLEHQTMWWDLPHGLEAELAYRRGCVLRTIASIQTQFLTIYSSRERQCKLGYDSSSSCDSFQLGEMIKFLTRKGLLLLVPFQSASPHDADYIWPDAYNKDIENLIATLRQCPSYQIDKNHSHCGLRSKLLPALDYIKSCIDTGLGIKLTRSKAGPSYDSWIRPVEPTLKTSHKRAWVGNGEAMDLDNKENKRNFDFASVKPKMAWGSASGDQFSRELFMAEKWNWVTEFEGGERLGKSFGGMIR